MTPDQPRTTPRTDSETWYAEVEYGANPKTEQVVLAHFARQLERELDALKQKLEAMKIERDAWVDDALLRSRQLAEMRALLVEWRETELDSMDEEYEPWIESFTARVDAVLGADHSAGAGKPIKEEG